ncbi:hypothetical protein QR680_012389 [Steinernema hermaphroditum]|uniref:Protein kinase domain-containing protein n=1 Tax=Steinernema hermaphroditum TaxID=289476 RepID=A0AA39M0N4_9BILA|nr:hypothetical protein QR680_012389 [Steinernema hermaphroditum]
MDCKVLRGARAIKSPHFCFVLDRGKVESRYRFIIMKLVGENLWDLRLARNENHFSMNTALKAAEQCLMAVEDLHRIGFLHRDVKPGNFAVGCPNTNELHTIFMLDFGLCRKFIGDKPHKDLRLPRAVAPFRGTTRYASLAAHRSAEQSRKDDIEAWLYMTVEFCTGNLPWRRCRGSDKDGVQRYKEGARKGDGLNEFLKDCPKKEFTAILKYLDALQYESIPDYDYIYYCVQHAMNSYKCESDQPLDWDSKEKYHGPTKADRDKRMDSKLDAKLNMINLNQLQGLI